MNIKINNNIIWKDCYHETDEVNKEEMYKYTVKFKGTLPIYCTSISKPVK